MGAHAGDCCGAPFGSESRLAVVIAPIVLIAVVFAIAVIMMIIPIAIVIAEIAVVVLVPAVIVSHPAAFSLPVAFVEPLSIMMRPDPASTFIWRAAPIALVPLVVVSHRIPIALNPNELRSGTVRHNTHHARRWRRANSDSNRNLCSNSGYSAQYHGDDQGGPGEPVHPVYPPP